jgi:AbrB family looped-hinge helix DNA binding protein
MSISTLTRKGQITIPKEIRDVLGLKEHDKVSFIKRGDDILIKPIKGDILDLRGTVKPKRKPEDFEEVRRITRDIIAKKVAKNE